MIRKVPTKDKGIVTTGIMTERIVPRNKNITIMTITMASNKASTTS